MLHRVCVYAPFRLTAFVAVRSPSIVSVEEDATSVLNEVSAFDRTIFPVAVKEEAPFTVTFPPTVSPPATVSVSLPATLGLMVIAALTRERDTKGNRK
jgi:hypothetical protein